MELVSKPMQGLVRTENQDRVMTNHISTSCAYMILCDGMGGENAGSFASNTAINLVSDYINNQYSDYMDDDMVRNMLVRSVHEANSKLYFIAQRDYEKHGMGTTCVIAFYSVRISCILLMLEIAGLISFYQMELRDLLKTIIM